MRAHLLVLASFGAALSANAQAQDRPCRSTEVARDPTGQADYVTAIRYAYDPAGHEVSEQITRSRQGVPGEKTGWKAATWDASGRMSTETTEDGPVHDAIAYRYETDAAGRVAKVFRTGQVGGEPIDESTVREYDARGALIRETLKATTGWTLVTTYTRDDQGREIERRDVEAGNKATTVTRTTRDALGRPVDVVTTLPDGSVEEQRWTYDPAGSWGQEQVIRGGAVARTIRFEYRCG